MRSGGGGVGIGGGPMWNEYVASLVPESVEQKLNFIIGNVPHDACMYYLKWLQDSLMIESRKDSESIYIDIVRHITLNMRSSELSTVNVSEINGFPATGSTGNPRIQKTV